MTLDSTRFQAGLRGAAQTAQATAARMKMAFGGVAAMFGVSAFGVVSGGGLAAGILKSAQAMSSLYDISRKSGANFEAFQRVSQAFRESGVSTEKFASTLPKIIRSVGEAQDGTMTYVDAFKQLNINLEEFAQQEPTEMLLRLADAWTTSTKSAQDFAAMTVIMGRNAADMRQALDGGREGIEAIGRTIDVTSTQSIERIKAVEDRITKLKHSLTTFGAEVANDLLDVGEGAMGGRGFGDTARELRKFKAMPGMQTFSGLSAALGADIGGGIGNTQQLQTDRQTLSSLRQTLGNAIGQYNTAGSREEQLRLSSSIDALQSNIAQLAYRIGELSGGGTVATDPIIEH